jgi:uncharacterized protein YndB with AHSA1/START domain
VTTPNHDAEKPRSFELEVEVPGTPEQVWEAIATGQGIAAWFVPAEFAEREGATVSVDAGWGMQESGTVTAWEPPRRFAYVEEPPASEAAPAGRLATEFLVEARSGGTCVVRLVSSAFGGGHDWDQELEDTRDGWRVYLRNLYLYLTRFPGQRCSWILVTGNAAPPQERAWAALTGALGLADAAEGERTATTAPGAPALAGTVEQVTDSRHARVLLLRLDEPAPGTAMVAVFTYGGEVYASLHAYLFGDQAPEVAAREAPAWRAWMAERFPSATAKTGAAAER